MINVLNARKAARTIGETGPRCFRVSAALALAQLGQANPQVVTPEVITAILAIVTNPQADVFSRRDGAAALGQLGQANPQAVTPEVIQALQALVAGPRTNSELRYNIASALGQLGQANLPAVTPEVIQALTARLKDNEYSEERIGAAVALFDIAVRDPSQETPLRDELEKLRDNPQPHVRIAASRALEMMAIGDLVQEARAHPEQIARIKSRLDGLSQSDEVHLKFAALFALQEIEKIKTTTVNTP